MELPSPQELEEQAKNEALSKSITLNHENEKNSAPTAAAVVATGTTASAAATPSASFLPSLWPSKNSSTLHATNNHSVISNSLNVPPPASSSSSSSAAPLLEGNSPNRKHGGGPLDPWIQKAFMAFRSNPNTAKEDSAMGNRHDPPLWLRMKQKQPGTSKVDSTVIRNAPEKDGEMVGTMFASGIGDGGGDGTSSGSSNSSNTNNNAVETTEAPMIDLLTNSMDVDDKDSIPVRAQNDVVLAPTGNVSIVMDDAHWINGNGMSSTELNQQDAIDISRENKNLSTNNADIGHENSKDDEDVCVGVETLYGSTMQDSIAVGSARVDDEDVSLSKDDAGAATNIVEASSKDNGDIAREEVSPLSEQVEMPHGSNCQDPIVNMTKAENEHVIGILSKDIIGVHNVGDESTDTAQDENNHSSQGAGATFTCETSGRDQTADSVQVHDNLVGVLESDKGAKDVVDAFAENGDKAREEMSHASEEIEISSGSISQDPIVGMTKVDVDDDGNDVKEKDSHHVSHGGEISQALQCQDPIVGGMNNVDYDDVVGVSKDDVAAMDVDNVVENNINHDCKGEASSDSQCQDPTVVLTKEDNEMVGISKDDVVATNHISCGGETSHDLLCQDSIADVTKADDGHMVGTSKDDVVAADGVNLSENNDRSNNDSVTGREETSDVSHCQDPIADVTKADDGHMVGISKDDAVAADKVEMPKGNVSDCDALVSGEGGVSRDSKCQDPIADITIADNSRMVGISKDDVDATDVSKNNASEDDFISTRRVEASHGSQCQDPIVDMTKADNGHIVGTSKDDPIATDGVNASENNDISNDDLVAGGCEVSRDTKCQDPIADVTKADDGDMVGISKDDVDASDKIDVSEVVNGDDNDLSVEGETSHDLQCQDLIVNMAKTDDGHMVGISKDNVDTTDKVDVSKDNDSENDIPSTRRVEASHSSTCQDYVVGSTKASNDNDDTSVEHGESINKITSDDGICNIAGSGAEANKVTNDDTRLVETSRDSLEVSNTKETEVVDTKSNAQDLSLVDSGARDIPSSDRKHSLRNRFVNWRSKADAVLQNNQVFQLAQKNIEETNKKLQQVVESRNIGSLGAGTGGYFRSPRKNTNTEKNEWHKNEIDEKIAPIGSLDDDLSFDSTGGKSSISEDSSEGSSVFADSSDEDSYSSSVSDTSSVYANGISTRRIRGNNLLKQRSFSSNPEAVSVVAAMPPTDAGEEIAKNQIGVTPTKSNITGRSSANGTSFSVDGSVPADVSPSIVSPITSYKGRYEPSTLRGINRNHVLQQIQGKVRSPSPVQHFTSTKATNDETEQKFESQTSLLLKSIPASKMKELAETLSPGQYLMVLRPGMLGVNLKQTFLPGYGVYVDHILPGGNAEKSGVVCIGDSVVKVGNVDVSKGTIYDVPGIIAGAKRPAIIILNGEHEIGVEDMDYLTVAFGLVNKIVNEATLGVLKSPTPDIPMGTEPWFSIVSDLPPETLRIEVQNWSKRRNNSKAAFSIIKAAFKQDQNLQKILKKAFRICCLDNRRLPFFASFLTNDDASNAAGDRTDLVSASTSLMLYLEIVSFQSLYAFASRKRITDHARLIAHKFLLRNESSEPLFNLRSLFPEDLIKDLQENLNLKPEVIDRSLFNNIETYLENSLVGTKFASFLLSDECARMRAYMRGTVCYIDPPLELLINNINLTASEANVSACNVLRFMLVYLLCQKENDALDKNFDNKIGISSKEAKRSIGSAGGLSCSIFLIRTLQPLLSEASKTLEHQGEEGNTNIIFKFICALEDFWDFFVAPRGGVLDASTYSNETNDLIEQIREALVTSVETCHITDTEKKLMAIVRSLLQDGHFSENLSKLRDDLLYDYHINHHSKYKAHIFHEFMCAEASQTSENKLLEGMRDNNGLAFTPSLRTGSISRLFRKVDIPKGVSQHRPAHATIDYAEIGNQHEHAKCNINADFAVIFSARSHAVESDTNTIETNNDFSVFDRSGFRRTVTASISGYGKTLSEKMPLEQIFPVTMVSYAMIPPLKDRAFKDSVDFGRRIKHNWEVSLVNFMAPNANINCKDQPNQFLYGVTLVMNEVDNCKEAKKAMAISLVAERNVIPAMRNSLMKLYEDKVLSAPNDNDCSSFVSSLEKLEAESDSSASLSVLLEPYLKMGSSPWVDQPLTNQAKTFERSSLEFLVESLTPVPLSLLFVTALLEQKIVFTSQRRSSLVSLIVGLRSLLCPMSWSHLIVPTVPPSLAADLVQYPAPFIIGIPLDNKESMDLLKVLPDDITLVDVDAGRVILTKRFLHHSEVSNTKNNDELNSVALRSQVLHLAESLGHVIGVYQSDSVWRCDSPLSDSIVHVESLRKVEAAQKVARSFIRELTAGLNTCCYWIEEEVHQKDIKAEQNILFDEDRFLHLKELRYQDQYFSLFESKDLEIAGHNSSIKQAPILALRMADFNLVIETFLRGQMISSFVSSQDKHTMPFW